MIQVKDMTDQQLNRKLTELQGYSVKPSSVNPRRYNMLNPQGQEFGLVMPTEGMVWNEYAFPYCTDPAASLEVQAKAIEVDASNFINRLAWIVRDRISGDMEWTNNDIAVLLNASLRERAEAAYITLQGAQE